MFQHLHGCFLFPQDVENFSTEIAFLRHEDARIFPITIEWQRNKCQQLNLKFSGGFEQHYVLTGEPLARYQPYQTFKTMATSAMLDTDIYVASMSWNQDAFESHMSWQRFSTNADNSIKPAI